MLVQSLNDTDWYALTPDSSGHYLNGTWAKMASFPASWDYAPGTSLEKIRAPLLAINSADDLINPPELGILEREIKRVPRGKAVVLPLSPQTRGHGTHTLAALWKDRLVALLKESE